MINDDMIIDIIIIIKIRSTQHIKLYNSYFFKIKVQFSTECKNLPKLSK